MAGREKKAKKLSNASKESPISSSKQPSILSYMSPAPQQSEVEMNQEANAAGGKKATKLGKGKLNPSTKINTLRGRSKTKANFKLIATLAQQSAKPVMKRGRPPLKNQVKLIESPDKSEDSLVADDSMVKKRGRKKLSIPPTDVTEESKTEGSDVTKAPTAKEPESKKTVLKNLPKKVVKKKQILVAQKGLTKRKVLLSKKILKSDAKQVDPKVLKKNLTAKLKSVSEKLEAKRTVADKDAAKENSETPDLEIPISEIKKEPGLGDTPNISDSRSSSPRTGTRKRNSADITISKAVLYDVPSSPGIKSPYSTRSERSSPLTLTPNNEQSPKVLRNGRQRKPKGLKNTLLSETVGQEFNKRRRLLSDTKVGELTSECLEAENKIKRFRSCSRDGSEISKCSDITESDLSTCDSASVDIDSSKLDVKDDNKAKKTPALPVAKIKQERISTDSSPNSLIKACTNDLPKCDASNVSSPVGTRNRDSVDNDNNNTDDKIKTDGPICDKLGKPEEDDTSLCERNAEKSLILDNMSKAFNQFVPNKKGNIRRSARQRKSTVKAKEHEETILAEQMAIELEIQSVKSDTGESPVSPMLNDTLLNETLDAENPTEEVSEVESSPVTEQTSSKITTKTFYGDPNRLSIENKKIETVEETPIDVAVGLPDIQLPEPDEKIEAVIDDESTEIRLHIDEDEPEIKTEDDTLKENVELPFAPKRSDPQDIGKLIDKLRHFEEQDKKKQEEKCNSQQTVMVTNDVVLISKPNAEQNTLVDLPNAVVVEKPKENENIINSLENNSSISIIKKDQIRKSFEIDLPSSVTLIKKTGSTTANRKYSTGSKEGEPVAVLDKSIGKDLTIELRKSIDKGILSLESSTANVKTSTINTGNGQSLSISIKPQTPKELVVIPMTSAANMPVANVTEVVSNPVTALISLPTPSPLMITPIPVSNSAPSPITSAMVVPKIQETQTHILTIDPTKSINVNEPTLIVEVAAKENIPQTISVIPKSLPISLPSGISIYSAVVPTPLKVVDGPTLVVNPTDLPIAKSEDIKPEDSLEIPSVKEVKAEDSAIEIPTEIPSIKSPLPNDTQNIEPVLVPESPVSQKHKQDVLRAVGLVSLKEADEAKQEKEKQKENIKAKPDGYTGTLKTVIKLNRTSQEKKSRSPLKMTLQKNKSRSSKVSTEGLSADSESDEGPSYTIHKEIGGSGYGSGSMDNHVTSGGHRKTHYSNRFNNHDNIAIDPLADVASHTNAPKEAAKNLVIPEKASSFGIHPDRLCQDQCFYCGGKFGLFDTPCHVAQIRSLERQKKILDNEEKLTVDSCLCDACYRHVDRRANCPGYRRKVGGGGGILGGPVGAILGTGPENEVADGTLCHATMCRKPAPHTFGRRWLVKMRNNISKVVQLDLDYPGLHTIPLCDMHYQAISRLMVCGLCKGGLSGNHVHYINQEYKTLNPLLAELGVPVEFKEKPAVCKLCRYFCTLLCKPPSPHQRNKLNFLKAHKRRLLIAHNIEVPDEESEPEAIDESVQSDSNIRDSISMLEGKEKKKSKNGKSRSKSKSSDIRKSTEDSHSRDTSSPSEGGQEGKAAGGSDNWKDQNNQNKQGVLEEDIESLISTNTIPIPNSNSNKTASGADASNNPPRLGAEISDNSDLEMMVDLDPAELEKQSELHALLQKCPSSTILQRGPIPNLTQKSRNIIKLLNTSAISRNVQNQRLMDKNAKRIQKLGQIITKNTDLEKAICSRLPNREEFTLEAANNGEKPPPKDAANMSVLKNLALNDECTIIESGPTKPVTKQPLDIHVLKSKLQLSNSFNQIKKNLKALSQIKKSKTDQTDSYSNPVKRLETNPSISVRELFPGEEEMNLQCSIEFGNVKGVTPDGWEKCNSTIQYDSDTKRLWHELQKPYGNQSSFLRHLILLEKYFRNGDLILSQNANCSAATYSESVQNRLRSYDSVPTGETVHLSLNKPLSGPSAPANTETNAVENVKPSQTSSLIDFRKQKSNTSGKSLLKTNQMSSSAIDHLAFSHMKNPAMVRPIESLLPSTINHAKIPKNVPISLAQINQSLDPNFNNFSKNDKNIMSSMSHLERFSTPLHPPKPDFPKPAEVKLPILPPSINIEAKPATPKSDMVNAKPKAPSLPPELIAINPDPQLHRKSIESVLKNIQQLAKGSSTPVNKPFPPHSEQTPGLSPITTATSIGGLIVKPAELPVSSAANTIANTNEQPKKSKLSKQWRPTLIPITDESKSKVAKEVLYQTADGRRLPSLVQVMSGGKPYHITIQDYNKMCVMRREKLQQLQKAEMAKKSMSTPPPSSIYDFTLDPPAIPIITTSVSGKLPSPPPYSLAMDTMALTTSPMVASTSVTNSINTKTSSVTSAKSMESQIEIAPNSGMEISTSILKNVGLKNITIAPILSSANDIRPGMNTSTTPPASIILPNITTGSSVASLPSIISQLGPSISVTTETGTKINTTSNSNVSGNATTQLVSCIQPITITSQAVLLPKIPKSLTVIPQTVTTPPSQTQQHSSSSQEP